MGRRSSIADLPQTSRSFSTDNTSYSPAATSLSCTARRPTRPRRRARCRLQFHEHLIAVHRASSRDLASDGGAAAGRSCGLSAVAGGVSAERELSDNFGDRAAAGRRSPDDGIVGGNTARGAVRPDSRRHPDDVVERARYDFDYATIRPQSRHRRRLDRHAGGHQKPAIRVQVNPQALAARGVGLEDVRNVISQANVDQPKGTLNSPRRTYTINTNDQLLSPDAYNQLIVAYRNGSPVRIQDIGAAINAPENDLLAGWFNQQRAIILAVQRQPGANVIATVDRVKAMLPQLQAAIPKDIRVSILSDRTETIRASVSDVRFTLVLTVALVVMVIFVFLRNFWATVIPAVTVPLSLIGTFAILYEFGYSLDNLSLMALTIAVGFVVDDAVVVIENIFRHLEEGLSPMQASIKGAGEIGFTIVSITLSLIAVFIPLFLMGGIVGRLFREFAVTVSVALVLSLLISLTLTPMMCAYLLKPEDPAKHGRLYRLLEAGFDGLLSGYERSLKVALRHRFVTLMVMLGTIGVTGYLYVIIPKGFFPQQDTGMIIAIPEASQAISFAAMEG